MNTKLCALVGSLLLAGVCAAKDHEDYQKGTLLRMDSAPCGMQEKGGKSVTGELLGTDSQSKKTQEVLCQEYVLQGEKVVTASARKMTNIQRCCPSAKPRNFGSTRTS